MLFLNNNYNHNTCRDEGSYNISDGGMANSYFDPEQLKCRLQ